MGMNINSSGNYNTQMGGSVPPEKKKDGLPTGQILTSGAVGGGVATFNHLTYSNQKSLLNKLSAEDLNKLSAEDLNKLMSGFNLFEQAQVSAANPGEMFIGKDSLEKTTDFLKKMDLEKATQHIGKNVFFTALAAGATALVYNKVFGGKKEVPPPTE